jgi:hypothetical protein
MKRLIKLLHVLPALLVLTLSAPASAGDSGPVIPKAVKGDQCVEPTDVMRRNHMDFLKHQRDDTMHKGIRTKKYSLKQCLECHVPPQDEAKAAEGEHFCKSCHIYAGVRIDCFQCHNTRPEKTAKFHPLVTPAMQATKGLHSPETAALLNKMAATKNTTGAAQ